MCRISWTATGLSRKKILRGDGEEETATLLEKSKSVIKINSESKQVSKEIQMSFIKHNLILILLLVAFFLKGLIFVALIPMHQGSDEYYHYSTVQYLAEPKEKTWELKDEEPLERGTRFINEFFYTDEIRAFSDLMKSWEYSGKAHNTQDFSPETVSSIEERMTSGEFLPYITYTQPKVIPESTGNLAHRIMSFVERIFSYEDAFTRYGLSRIPAIFYGMITIVCAFYIALWSGMTRNLSLLIAGIIAFHPQFGATTAIINYDPLLIVGFSLSLLCYVSVLRHGLNPWNSIGLFLFPWIAMEAKATGGILFVPSILMFFWGVFSYLWKKKFKIRYYIAGVLSTALLAGGIFFLIPSHYFDIATTLPRGATLESAWPSIQEYILEDSVFNSGKIERTAITYWGAFGWLDSQIHPETIDVIQVIELIGYIALAFGFFIYILSTLVKHLSHALHTLFYVSPFAPRWKKLRKKPQIATLTKTLRTIFSPIASYFYNRGKYLPEWKYIFLFIFMMLLLRFVIHLFDWRLRFMDIDSIGLPGRYFLPTIIPHIILVLTGWAMIFRNTVLYSIFLKLVFVAMVLLSLYALFWITLPRYYL